jgi:hypothetical protein
MEAPGKGIPVAGFDYTKDVHIERKQGSKSSEWIAEFSL